MPSLLQHKLDTQVFLSLQGNVQLKQQELARFARGGVDGYGFQRLGSRGKPFELVSTLDVPDLDSGKAKYFDYTQMVGTDPLTLIKDFVNWGTYVVQSVDLVGLKAIALQVGGIQPLLGHDSFAILTCRWVLVG